ncbi:hypothetical protein C0991_006007 [Blastosporella zonata]|nr:hypothetical protein C0991_006007 [Blastosporella zonata]
MYQPPSSGDAVYNPYLAAHSHYPSHYTTNTTAPYSSTVNPYSTTTTTYFPPFPHLQQPKPDPVPEGPPPPPDLTTVTPPIASRALQRLISLELRDVGFKTAHKDAVRRIEVDVLARSSPPLISSHTPIIPHLVIEQLFTRAHEYANLSNRAGAIATDLLLACNEFDMPPDVLRAVADRQKVIDSPHLKRAPDLLPAASRSPSPDLLPSDDEGAAPTVPQTLRTLPSYFPSLPPKHTYLRTPASPPKKAALPSLEKKLKTAGLVQESLRNLLVATEDSTNQEDGELLGHLVNWETSAHPRKRWKPSAR